eukprot:TRINITY_DN31871_c0_g1_i1.p1 TRINITY_DN31871_c0_g1~~TRINITY_DN31871_c0_g1_i1.p1  ORF type:complete len:515 (-),score=118.33 TRINITY_DN31871_c0_g1_i1:195-1739(-)
MNLISRRVGIPVVLLFAGVFLVNQLFPVDRSPTSVGPKRVNYESEVPPPGVCPQPLVAPPEPVASVDPNAKKFNWRTDLRKFHSQDVHTGPVGDMKWLVKNMLGLPDLVFNDWNLGIYSCGSRGSECGIPKVGTLGTLEPKQDLWNLCPAPHSIRRKFFEEMKDTFREVDAFFCSMVPANCELFLPFNKPIIMMLPVPLEFGRESPERFWELVNNVIKMSQDPRVLFAANNLYHQMYVKYFTGLDIPLIPSYCGYAESERGYNPTRPEILLGGNYHVYGTQESFIDPLNVLLNGTGMSIASLKGLYKHYTWDDVTQHKAIVNIPYCNSVMSYFEYYRVNMPMLFPSKKFIVEMESWVRPRVYWRFTPDPAEKFLDVPGPNEMYNPASIAHWLQFSDWYQWPHIIYFDSLEDLADKIKTTDFKAVSDKMKEYNKQVHAETLQTWTSQFDRLFKDTPPGGYPIPDDFDTAMLERWGVVVPPDLPQCTMYAFASGGAPGYSGQAQLYDRRFWNVSYG